ncbi:antitoxin MazE family protein [Hoeflea sp.]|uniref:antitoxin MazE family protein n=1 Tax=Hoeflea sp. TaxID=1940281 RepID=UPI003A8DE06F
MPIPVNQRVQKRRDALRAAGLRPVQIWVPDTRRPGFADECSRQARQARPHLRQAGRRNHAGGYPVTGCFPRPGLNRGYQGPSDQARMGPHP